MQCKNCFWLRKNVKVKASDKSVAKEFNKITHPCNRFPMNVLRAPNEPACGEFLSTTELN